MELYIVSMITLSCINYGVDPRLALSIAFTESGFTNITHEHDGKSGSYGPMQIKRIAAREIGMDESSVAHLESSIVVGVKYLKKKIDSCRNIESAVVAYNSGHCGKSSGYSRKVMSRYRSL
jgi:soluble lytic murein transglycosylase-like protein